MYPLSSPSSSRDLVEILRKLQTLGYFQDLAESDLTPQNQIAFFNRILNLFSKEIHRNQQIRPVPAVLGDGNAVDLFELCFVVRERGGYESVSGEKGWGSVSAAIGFDSCVGPCVKLVFFKYLGAVERWLDKVLGKKENCENSKKNQFLTPVKDGGRKLTVEKGEGFVGKRHLGLTSCSGYFKKRKREALGEMLNWLLRMAKSPKDAVIGGNHRENYSIAVSARRVMFLKFTMRADGDMWDFQRVPRMLPSIYDDNNYDAGALAPEGLRCSPRHHALSEQPNLGCYSESSVIAGGDKGNGTAGKEACSIKRNLRSDILDELDEIMERLSENEYKKEVAMNRIAEVPLWTDKSASTTFNADEQKWLGEPIWPPEGRAHCSFKQDSIGKGRKDSCNCGYPGSVECVRFHVAEKRVQLKRELGSAFKNWGFNCMGEEVALSWTDEEAEKFKSIMHLNPLSDNLWADLNQAFPLKGKKSLVSYYFNVFTLARRCYQNRMTPDGIDSDAEDAEFGFLSIPFGQDAIKVYEPKTNFCAQNGQCLDIED